MAGFTKAFYTLGRRGRSNYCYLVVPLFLYLLWDQKDKFCFSEYTWNPLGFVPLTAAFFLIFVGEFGSVETLMYLGVWGCVVGMLFLLYRRCMTTPGVL
ncbi:MAG: archaeosortase/exosortase family protein [Deltaproteobacteria bacterium]|nr:archaeosortase/exosortase family protein [Deltaproteobacteria bacterium]